MKQRKVAANWRDYLKDTKEAVVIIGWVWNRLTNDSSKRALKIMLVLSFISTIFGMAAPWVLSQMIDGLIDGELRVVVWAVVGYGLANLLSQAFGWIQGRYREYAAGENIIEVDSRTAEMFFEKSLGQHIRDNSVLSVGNLEKGRHRLYNVVEMIMWQGVRAIFNLLLAFVFVWFLSPVAGMILTFILLVHLVWTLFLNRWVAEVTAPVDLRFRKHNRYRHERWDKIERVKTSGKEEEETGHMRRWIISIIKDDRSIWLRFITVVNLRAIAESLAHLAIVGYGASRVWVGAWTVGPLFPLFSWSRRFMQELWQIGQLERRINGALPSIRSLKQVLDIEPDVADRPEAEAVYPERTPRVAFEEVSHSYGKETIDEETDLPILTDGKELERQQVLDRVSFAVEPGEKVGLIGPSGAGKTTVMRLLQRYSDPTEGKVTIGGHDLRDIRLSSWQRLVSYVSQQPQVIDGTIRSNLLYGLDMDNRESISDDELWALVRKLKIDFGDRLVDGLDTKVGPRGIKLSGGEQQRLMIGAAAIKRPRFWIVDEATSSLDSTTEKAVQRGLTEVMEEGTSALIIAHRLSTVRYLCDRFIVLNQQESGSRIEAEAGSFEELYGKSPTFRQLADDQDLGLDSQPEIS